MKKILIACEESQAVCKEFRALGYEAYSCDILPESGGHPEWHIQDDVFNVINQGWDMMIAFPPCTYLSVSGAQWYYHPKDKDLPIEQRRPHPKYLNRNKDREYAKEFFIRLYNSNIKHIAIENPVGIMNTQFMKPTQIIQPWMFGDVATKTTCLWLKNLPKLQPTNIVGKGERTVFASGKSHPKWYAEALAKAKTPEERRNLRSKTFPGIAKAMAEQWTQIKEQESQKLIQRQLF
jgi:site-specific DNA-cytosine methylase